MHCIRPSRTDPPDLTELQDMERQDRRCIHPSRTDSLDLTRVDARPKTRVDKP
jgi:hypothetical protein